MSNVIDFMPAEITAESIGIEIAGGVAHDWPDLDQINNPIPEPEPYPVEAPLL